MSTTVAASANKSVVYRGKKTKIMKAAKRGLISEKQMCKIEANA